MSFGMSGSRDPLGATLTQDSVRNSSDGRHLRSERSRQKIVDAMTSLVREGNFEPSQAEVAEQAKVSFRTVSRHFEDMETLYRHSLRQIQMELFDKFLAPFSASDWRGRLYEAIERRAAAYEVFRPYRVFVDLRRYRSEFMRHVSGDLLAFDVSVIKALLPKEVQEDTVLTHALENALSFESWLRLRDARNLSNDQIVTVLKRTADCLLASVECE